MTKGKFGITMAAVAALAFVLAFLNIYTVLILLVGYAIIAENNNWLTRQVLHALYLRVAFTIASVLISGLFSGINALFSLVRAYGVMSVMSSINSFFQVVLNIVLFLICIMAFLKVVKEQDVKIPVISDLVDKSMGIFKPKPVKPAPQPAEQPPVAPPPPAAPSPEPVKADNEEWTCSCGNQNTGKFCSVCGTKK